MFLYLLAHRHTGTCLKLQLALFFSSVLVIFSSDLKLTDMLVLLCSCCISTGHTLAPKKMHDRSSLSISVKLQLDSGVDHPVHEVATTTNSEEKGKILNSLLLT
jgi:hypothetical protein